MSTETRAYFRERGWNWYIKSAEEHPKPRPTHWKYGSTSLMIPTLYADLHDKTVEVQV